MVTLFAAAAFAFGLAGVFGGSYYLLLLFLCMHGVGAGAFYPTAYKISTAISVKEKRGLSSAVINSGMGVGSILGLIVAGPILSLFSAWQSVLILLSFFTLIVAFLLHTMVNYREEGLSSSLELPEFKRLLRNRSFVMVCIAMFCSTYGYWVILSWAPSFLQTTRHLDLFYSGLATALFSGIAIPSSLLVGRYSDRVGRKQVALVILPLASLAILLMAFASSLFVFIFAIIAYGIVGKLTLEPMGIAWVPELVSSESLGAALALLNVFGITSAILAPVITGILTDLTGTLVVGFYCGAGIVLLGAFFLLFANDSSFTAVR
jgi:MFS family permease